MRQINTNYFDDLCVDPQNNLFLNDNNTGY